MPELSPRRRLLVLAICCMSLFIVGLDVTIVNIALPSIKNDLHASVSGLQWTLDAYTLVLASLLMLSGSTADRRRPAADLPDRAADLHAGLAAVQPGAGPRAGSSRSGCCRRSADRCSTRSRCRSSPTRSPTRASEPGPSASGAAWSGISLALGPVIGGALVESVGWRSIFWINIPVGPRRRRALRAFRAGIQGRPARAGSTRSARCW